MIIVNVIGRGLDAIAPGLKFSAMLPVKHQSSKLQKGSEIKKLERGGGFPAPPHVESWWPLSNNNCKIYISTESHFPDPTQNGPTFVEPNASPARGEGQSSGLRLHARAVPPQLRLDFGNFSHE